MPGSGRARIHRLSSRQESGTSVHPSLSSPQLPETDVSCPSDTTPRTTTSSVDSCSTRQGRGKTKGISLMKRRKKGERFNISIPHDRKRIVGEHSTDLITEAGIVVRHYAPLNIKSWATMPIADKNKMWEILKEKFRLLEDDEVKKVLEAQLRKQYRDYRCHLHVSSYKPHDSMERAVQHCPPDVPEDQWHFLCEYFNSDKFKERSAKNQENRKKQTIVHTSGSKGFARLEFELMDLKNRPSMTLLWKETHYSKKRKCWGNEVSEKVYDEVQMVKLQSDSNGGSAITDDEAFLQILGQKSGYIRGRGAGPKPISFSSQARLREVEEAREREVAEAKKEAEEARREAEEARKESSELREQVSELRSQHSMMQDRQSEMEARFSAQWQAMMDLV